MADDKLVSRLLLIGLAVVVLAILITQYTQFGKKKETFASPLTRQEAPTPMPTFNARVPAVKQESADIVNPSEPLRNESYKAVNYDTKQKMPSDCAPRDKLTVDDLLPKDAANSKWAQVAPAGQGNVTDQNFLTAGYLIGVNTVGQSMRNANLQLRSDPPIDRMNVGPWNQTTIEYDASRRFFEIAEC